MHLRQRALLEDEAGEAARRPRHERMGKFQRDMTSSGHVRIGGSNVGMRACITSTEAKQPIRCGPWSAL